MVYSCNYAVIFKGNNDAFNASIKIEYSLHGLFSSTSGIILGRGNCIAIIFMSHKNTLQHDSSAVILEVQYLNERRIWIDACDISFSH